MSYSTCFLCGTMVGGYNKYCDSCLAKYSLVQSSRFVPKTKFGTPEREVEKQEEIKKDSLSRMVKRLSGLKLPRGYGGVIHSNDQTASAKRQPRGHKFGRKVPKRRG